jgi:hypothetical protein
VISVSYACTSAVDCPRPILPVFPLWEFFCSWFFFCPTPAVQVDQEGFSCASFPAARASLLGSSTGTRLAHHNENTTPITTITAFKPMRKLLNPYYYYVIVRGRRVPWRKETRLHTSVSWTEVPSRFISLPICPPAPSFTKILVVYLILFNLWLRQILNFSIFKHSYIPCWSQYPFSLVYVKIQLLFFRCRYRI